VNEKEQAEALRRDLLEHPNWPDQDKRFAEQLAILVESGAASYDPDSGVASVLTGKLIEMTAKGKLSEPTKVILFATQLANVEIRFAITDEGLLRMLRSLICCLRDLCQWSEFLSVRASYDV